jgi:hypothetical protein
LCWFHKSVKNNYREKKRMKKIRAIPTWNQTTLPMLVLRQRKAKQNQNQHPAYFQEFRTA